MSLNRKGFTLLELIMVLVILGVLASVALSTMSKFKANAMCAEAIMRIGTIKDALRMQYYMYGELPTLTTQSGSSECFLSDIDPTILAHLGIPRETFRGRYFDENCYKIVISDPKNIDDVHNRVMAYVDPGGGIEGANNNSHRGDVLFMIDPGALGGYVVMYLKNGNIKQAAISILGYVTDNLSAD